MKTVQSTRRNFLRQAGAGCLALAAASLRPAGAQSTASAPKPNFVIIFCDDLGYGDLGVFGHPTIKTPNLDRMAAEGQKWTNFYAAASVCTPSRAGIMTGRLPIRNGMCSDKRRVLFPDSSGGLPTSEITIAKALKGQGYATGCIGKWHLGHLPQYLPTRHGFDSYFGIPYSNDMDQAAPKGVNVFRDSKSEYFNVPLMRNEAVIERPADQTTLTQRYSQEAVAYIKQNRDKPFFLYLAHSLPHVPLFRSKEFEGISERGLYGDVIEEIDDGVGKILSALRDEGLSEKTLVVFTSDNGPWLVYNEQGGSAGLLREGKGTTFEGGMREPTLFWWPGKIKPAVVSDMGSTLDLLPTFVSLAGGEIPTDRVYDGYDLTGALLDEMPSPRDEMFYYRNQTLWAVRKGPFKAHFRTQRCYVKDELKVHDPPLLYHLGHDPGEQTNIASRHPDVLQDLIALAERHKASVVPVKDQLAGRITKK